MNWYKFVATILVAVPMLAHAVDGAYGEIESIRKNFTTLGSSERPDAFFLVHDHSVNPEEPDAGLAAIYQRLGEVVRQNDEAGTGCALLRRLSTFHKFGMADSVLHYSPESMAFLESCAHWAGYYYAALLQVESFIRVNRPILAMNSARRLYREARIHKNDYGMGATAYILGNVHYGRGNLNAAEQYMKEAIKYLEDTDDPTMLFNAYDRMWAIHCGTGAYQTALDVLAKWEKALDQHLAKHENSDKYISGRDARFYLWCGMACVFTKLRMFPEARHYISLAGEEAEARPLYTNHLNLVKSGYFEELRDYESAIGWFRRTIPENWNYPGAHAGYEAASTFAALLSSAGRYREAADVYRRALGFAERIQSAEMDAQLQELQNLYRFDKMEGRTNSMKVTGAIIIFALLSVFTIYFVYANRLRNKNRALSEQLREVNRLRSWRQAYIELAEPPADDADVKTANGDPGVGTVAGGRKNENIVWLACRKMGEEKLFCDPALNRKQLADMLGTNENYLASAIRDVNEGQTVSDFINGFRLDYACRLIAEFPQMKLETIAQESGFMTRSTLFRLFHKKFGMSPSQYRVQQMKERKAV